MARKKMIFKFHQHKPSHNSRECSGHNKLAPMIKMDDCSDSEEKVSATKKKREQDNVDFLSQSPRRSTKKRVVYFAKSDSELESNEDGGSLIGFQNDGLDHDSLVT